MNKMNFYPEWRSEDYYFFPDDLRKYPDAWCYVVWSRRGPGKTYSALRWAYEENIPMVYMKRTIEDVSIICTHDDNMDLSPYVPINRDGGYVIAPKLIKKGIGGFYDTYDESGENVSGAPFSYIVALNAMKTIKGMDMSNADWMLLDEFIPQKGEVVKHAEGEMLLDMYMTIARDRVKRGRAPLKLILFANAEEISTPITRELDLMNDMANLNASGQSHMYLDDRGILLHHITQTEIPLQEAEQSGIFKAMGNTAWGLKTFGGEFANNDFTDVGKEMLKNYHPVTAYLYRNKTYYVYRKGADIYVCRSAASVTRTYDLSRESEQNKFYYDYVLDIKDAWTEKHCRFSHYDIKDLLIHYKTYFNIV